MSDDLINDKKFLLRLNQYTRSIILRDIDFNGDSLNQEVVDYIKNENIQSIELNDAFGFKLDNLNFLNSIPEITSLCAIKFGGIDYSNLKKLKNLQKFINNYSSEPIDFLPFNFLKELNILWSPKRQSFLQSQTLEKLTLYGYKGKTLRDFKNLSNLKHLSLISSSLQDLEGIQNLENLENLEIYYNSKLTDLSKLSTCKNLKKINIGNLSKITDLSFLKNSINIEKLGVTNCKNIKNNKVIFELENLKVLGYYDSGSIASIRGIEKLKHLERFSIGSTNIEDGDLQPLLSLHQLVWCSFKNRKHYSLKQEEVEKILNIHEPGL